MKREARQTEGSVAQAGREFSRAIVMGKEGHATKRPKKPSNSCWSREGARVVSPPKSDVHWDIDLVQLNEP